MSFTTLNSPSEISYLNRQAQTIVADHIKSHWQSIEARISECFAKRDYIGILRLHDALAQPVPKKIDDWSKEAKRELLNQIGVLVNNGRIKKARAKSYIFSCIRPNDPEALRLYDKTEMIECIKVTLKAGSFNACLEGCASYSVNYGAAKIVSRLKFSALIYQTRLYLAEITLRKRYLFLTQQHITCFLKQYPSHERARQIADEAKALYLQKIEEKNAKMVALNESEYDLNFTNYYQAFLEMQFFFDVGAFKQARMRTETLLDQQQFRNEDRAQLVSFFHLVSKLTDSISQADKALDEGNAETARSLYEEAVRSLFDLTLPTPPVMQFDQISALISDGNFDKGIEEYLRFKMNYPEDQGTSVLSQTLEKAISKNIITSLAFGKFSETVNFAKKFRNLFPDIDNRVYFFWQKASKFLLYQEIVDKAWEYHACALAEPFAQALSEELAPSPAKNEWQQKYQYIHNERLKECNGQLVAFEDAVAAYQMGNFETAFSYCAQLLSQAYEKEDNALRNKILYLCQVSKREMRTIKEVRVMLDQDLFVHARKSIEELFKHFSAYLDSEVTNQYLNT